MNLILLTTWLVVGAIQLGVPLAYFAVMRRIGASRSYGLPNGPVREPIVSVIIPTFNEASVIESKLSDIVGNGYPAGKIELIVVDSASRDGTADVARRFLEQRHLNGLVIEEEKRTGKSGALNIGLRQTSGELVCISDAECRWEPGALRNAVKYLEDPTIGAVSGVHGGILAGDTLAASVEGSYRSVYRMLRISESKLSSTPIGEGEIQVFRKRDLDGFDPNVGGDDTCAALCMTEKGLRAISADDVVFYDPAPPAWRARFRQKIRRGQHVLQAFLKHRKLLRGKGSFSRFIFPMEFFLYSINPLLFPVFLVLTGLVMASSLFVTYLVVGAILLAVIVPDLRTIATTYISNNITMIAAIIQEARGNKQLVWTKIDENRPSIVTTQPLAAQ